MPITPITLTVQSGSLPVRIGVPFAESENLLATTNLRVKNPSGTVIAGAGAFDVLVRWGGPASDTSKPIRVALVSFKPTAGAGAYTVDDSAASFTASPITVTTATGTIRVQTASLDVTLNRTARDLVSSFKIGGTEQLHATNRPRLSATVSGGNAVIKTTAYSEAGTNQITVTDASGFSNGQTLELYFASPRTGFNATQISVAPDVYGEYFIAETPKRRFVVDRAGANVVFTADYVYPRPEVPDTYLPVLGTPQNPAPYDTPLIIEDKDLLDDYTANGGFTIQSISGNTITFTSNLRVKILIGTMVRVAGGGGGGGGGPVVADFTPDATTVERQTEQYVSVKQQGYFKVGGTGSANPAYLQGTIRWHFYAGQDWAQAQIRLRNFSGDENTPCVDAIVEDMKFTVPTASSGSGSDSCSTDSAAKTRLQNDTAAATVSAGTFKMCMPEFALQFPKAAAGDSSGLTFTIFPGAITFPRDRATSVEVFLGQSADAGAPLAYTMNATLPPAYVVSTKAFRTVTTVRKTWQASDFGGSALLAEAANYAEGYEASAYDVSVCTGARPWTVREYILDNSVSNSGLGWTRYGTLGWAQNIRCYNHYDTQLWLLTGFLRSANPTAFRWGSAFARFMADYGVFQSRKYFQNDTSYQLQGISRYENEGSDAHRPSHSWYEGLWMYWALTGDEAVREAAQLSVGTSGAPGFARHFDWVSKPSANPFPGAYRLNGTGNDEFNGGNGGNDGCRWVGWPVLTLLAAYEATGEAALLTKAGQYVNCFVAGEVAQGSHGVYLAQGQQNDDTNPGGTNSSYAYFGYAMIGIVRYAELTGDANVRSFLVRVADCLLKGDAALSAVGDAPGIQLGEYNWQGTGKYMPQSLQYMFWLGTNTTLSASLAANGTSMTVAQGNKILTPSRTGVGASWLLLTDGTNREIVLYADRSGNTITGLTRAQSLTAARAWPVGTKVIPLSFDAQGLLTDICLPVVAFAAKVTGRADLRALADTIFVETCLHRGGPTATPVDTTHRADTSFYLNGAGATSTKNFGQHRFGANGYQSQLMAAGGSGGSAPTITSLNPSSATAGGAGFSLVITGTNFQSGATAKWNGAARTTVFNSATQLTVTIPAGDIAAAGTASVTVQNPDGQTSGASTFTVNNPLPAISSISPTSATAGSGGLTLTVNGAGFNASTVIKVGGQNRTTTYVSPTQVTAAVLSSDTANAGTIPVVASNPTPGGGDSSPATFTVTGASSGAPTITGLTPSSATAGGGAATVVVAGANFQNGAVARVGGANRATTFVSATQITFVLTVADRQAAGTLTVTVLNPDGQSSGGATFTVNNPSPTITSIAPTSVTVGQGGASGVNVTVNGTNFNASSVGRVGGQNRPTFYLSATTLLVNLSAADVASAGTRSLTVFNPTPGGGTSPPATLTVANPQAPAPVISSLTPSSAPAAGPNFYVLVTGANFQSGVVARWNGSPRTTQRLSATQLTVLVTAADITAVGTGSVTVLNPDGQASNALAFTVTQPSPTPVAEVGSGGATSGDELPGGGVAVSLAGWSDFETFSPYACGMKVESAGIGFQEITYDLGGGLRYTTPVGHPDGVREYAVKFLAPNTLQPSVMGPFGATSRAMWLYDLFRRCKREGNKPVVINDPITGEDVLVQFADKTLTLERIEYQLFGAGVKLVQLRLGGIQNGQVTARNPSQI